MLAGVMLGGRPTVDSLGGIPVTTRSPSSPLAARLPRGGLRHRGDDLLLGAATPAQRARCDRLGRGFDHLNVSGFDTLIGVDETNFSFMAGLIALRSQLLRALL